MFEVKIISDSISLNNNRLTTFVLTYPRYIHAEMLTHRVFSRNAQSSRAIPVSKMIQKVQEHPVFPLVNGRNKPGMSSDEILTGEEDKESMLVWATALQQAIEAATQLERLGQHKQWANRILEPFATITTIVSSTEWNNFFFLRTSKTAQPEIQLLAQLMKVEYEKSTPVSVYWNEYHLPFIKLDDLVDISNKFSSKLEVSQLEIAKKVSTARCARVSYLTHEGKRDIQKDIDLCDKLLHDNHYSPFEHIARPYPYRDTSMTRNYVGWKSYRAEIDNLP